MTAAEKKQLEDAQNTLEQEVKELPQNGNRMTERTNLRLEFT